jgi:hypothetical protein
MANYFKILRHLNGESVHLKLVGEFDDQSARQLIQTIFDNQKTAEKMFIHTDSLDRVQAVGRAMFQTSFLMAEQPLTDVVFTGRNAQSLAPAGAVVR